METEYENIGTIASNYKSQRRPGRFAIRLNEV